MSSRTTETRYTIKPGIPWQIMQGHVLILNPQNYEAHELDEVGTCIWEGLSRGEDLTHITSNVCDRFEVESKKARLDIVEFLSELKQHQLIEASESDR